MINCLFGLIALFFSPGSVFAGEIMFEGYYRIELAGKHVGYSIQRYEFDPKSKTFDSISFLRLKIGDQVTQQSLKAKANDKFNPISYQFTSQDGKDIKTIDASFKGEIMQLKISDGKKLKNETHKIPKGSFLTSFLQYLMMQKPMPLNQAFKYSAIAEEDGGSYWGKALLSAKEDRNGYVVLKILNTFKNEDFVSKLAAVPDSKEKDKYVKGEILGTSSPSSSVSSELVTSANLATEGQLVPNKTLISIFGSMPTGKINIIANAPTETAPPPPEEK